MITPRQTFTPRPPSIPHHLSTPRPRVLPARPSLPTHTYPTPAYPAPGLSRVMVPGLTGRSLADAVRLLRQSGLTYGGVSVLRVVGGSGVVLSSQPGAGARVPLGSAVNLVVSSP